MQCVNIVHRDSKDKDTSEPNAVFPEQDYKRLRKRLI